MADIYYTPAQVDWTIADISVNATTQFNLYDKDFDSQWTATGAVADTEGIWIDRGATVASGSYASVDAVAITFYSGSHTALTGTVSLHQNTRVDTETTVGAVSGSLSAFFDADKQIFIRDIDDGFNLRYIQILFEGLSVDPTLTQVMLLSKRSVRNASIRGSHEFPRWYSKDTKLDGSLKRVSSTFIKPVQVFRKHYPLFGDAEITTGINIHNDCRGMQQAFIYQPETALSSAFICRMTNDTARIVEIEQDNEEQVFEFEEIYKIKSGFNT